MRQFMIFCIAAVLLVGIAAVDGAETAPSESPEVRLLRAELLEVSSGELDKAVEIYHSLIAGKSTPEAVKAEARLYLARCHRKRGELERAKTLLEEVVAEHAANAEIVRRARSYLRELREGKAVNRNFDWLGELQRNPEVQARVFDYVMDLVDSGEKAERSGKQLLALGTLALPTLKQMIENSRDPAHRRRVGLILLHLGKFEYLEAALPPDHSFWGGYEPLLDDFIKSLSSLGDSEKKELLEAFRSHPECGKIGGIRDICMLYLGDRTDLEARLSRFEGRYLTVKVDMGERNGIRTVTYQSGYLRALLKKEHEARTAMAKRILDPECSSNNSANYVRMLEDEEPGLLTVKHYLLVAEKCAARNEGIDHYLAEIEKRNGLTLLIKSPQREALLRQAVRYFQKTYMHKSNSSSSFDPTEVPGLKDAPEDWAAIFRASDDPAAKKCLIMLAKTQDSAVSELVSWLHSDSFAEENLKQFYWGKTKWRPSKAYCETMAQLLSCKKDHVKVVALDALCRAQQEYVPSIMKQLTAIIAEAEDSFLKRLAFYTILRRFGHRPETEPDVVHLLLGDYKRSISSRYSRSRGSSTRYYDTSVPSTIIWRNSDSNSLLKHIRQSFHFGIDLETVRKLHPFVLKQVDTQSGQKLYTFLFSPRLSDEQWMLQLINDFIKLELHKNNTIAAFAIKTMCGKKDIVRTLIEKGSVPEGFADAMKNIAVNGHPAFPVDVRKSIVELVTGLKGYEPVTWYDWPEFIVSKDPLVPAVESLLWGFETNPVFSDAERKELMEKGVRSPWREVHRFMVTAVLKYEKLSDDEKITLLKQYMEVPGDKRRDDLFREVYIQRNTFNAQEKSLSRLASSAAQSKWEDCRCQVMELSFLYDALEAPMKTIAVMLDDKSPGVREATFNRLMGINNVQAAPLLIKLLKEPEERFSKIIIINRLELLATPECAEALIELINDKNVEIRNAALRALKNIREKLAEKKEWELLLEELSGKAEKKGAETPARER